MRRLPPVLAAAALLATSCARAPTPPPAGAAYDPAQVDGARALREVADFLATGPRDSGTPGAERAAAWLRDRLRVLGVAAEIDAFDDESPRGRITFRNVVGRIPGRGTGLLILGSHYDTKSGIDGFQGANDGGSSTGLLLELARVMAAGPAPACEIQFVFFDGEECMESYGPKDGLHGSRRHAAELVRTGRAREVKGVFVLDMIGDRNLNVSLPRNSEPALISALFDAARAEGARGHFSLSNGMMVDDHEPFVQAGMPAVDVIDFEYGRTPGANDLWHTPDDRLDQLSAESLQIVGRVVLRAVNARLAD